VPPDAARAKPLAPESLAPEAQKGPKQAVITGETNFLDPANSVSTFEGNVKVRHPDFDMDCDRLEVFMKKQEKKAGAGPTAPPGSTSNPKVPAPAKPEPAAPAEEEQGSGIEKAIATGLKVIAVQHTPEGDKIGTGRKITYDGKTGDMVFTGMPTIQDGSRRIVATDPSTVLTITGAGKILTKGPNQVFLDQESPKKGGSNKPRTAATVPPKPPSNPVPVSSARPTR
jgi:lipopolysaccharide export system protein LptA